MTVSEKGRVGLHIVLTGVGENNWFVSPLNSIDFSQSNILKIMQTDFDVKCSDCTL